MWDLVQDKVILITGGTGFLGKTLAKRFLEYEPQSIRIFSRDEVKHFRFNREFPDEPRFRNLIGDVRDFGRLLRATRGVDLLIHAAALKRIDLLEYNVAESIKTNVIGTLNVANAALRNNVSEALFISTDKACSPLNSYGACKMLGERIFTEMNYSKGKSKTILSSVRYGNVLASTGSVIPFFKSKIQNGERIPLTHPDMTRFIISADQAVNLITKALAYCIGGEVVVPIIPSARMIDLIEVLKEVLDVNNEIDEVGIRPGEKITEVLINEFEMNQTYKYDDIYVISSLIQDYQKLSDMPVYVTSGEKMNSSSMEEYSSSNHLLTKEELKAYLLKLNLI